MENPTGVMLHYLSQLQQMLEKIASWCGEDNNFLQLRLHESMLPFGSQVSIAAGFALRGCCPMAGREVPSFAASEQTFDALLAQLDKTIHYLSAIPSADFVRPASEILSEHAGFAEVSLPRQPFFESYIVPNFFFHLAMVYAIARSQGVPLSKQDYDGYHQYPVGFSFETKL